MRNSLMRKGFGAIMALALCAVMVSNVAAVPPSNLAVPVNGGWVVWVSGFPTFTLNDPGTFKYVSSCAPSGTALLTISNFGVPLTTISVPSCVSDNVVGQTVSNLGPDDYYGRPGALYFSLSLPPGLYSLSFNYGVTSLVSVIEKGALAQWVRVDAYGKPLTRPAIILTVNDPPLGAWTSVQWLNLAGTQWTDVEAWLGPLDQSAYGWMPHWIDDKDMGTGPFRWVVYDKDPSQGGKVWGMTQAFYFPKAYEWTWFTVNKGDVMVTAPVVPAQP